MNPVLHHIGTETRQDEGSFTAEARRTQKEALGFRNNLDPKNFFCGLCGSAVKRGAL
jgi:hypothetical protein